MKTFDVRIWKIREVPSAADPAVIRYQVRWKVAGKVWYRTFDSDKAAKGFHAKLLTAKNDGIPFETETGQPFDPAAEEMKRQATGTKVKPPTVFDLASRYAGMKWPDLAAKSRETTANVLAAVTIALVADRPGKPDDDVLWKALYGYAFVPAVWPEDERPKRIISPHGAAKLPPAQRLALAWVRKASLPVTDLVSAKVARQALDALKVTRTGARAGDVYFRRRRGVLSNFISYLIEEEVLDLNPLAKLKKTEKKLPKAVVAIEREVTFSPAQGAELLTAVSYVGSYKRARGRRLVVFFALVIYAGLRPEEALGLRKSDCHLPETGWGRLTLRKAKPTAGKRWTDTGKVHDDRGLKGRGQDETRPVPIPPVLVAIIRAHIEQFGVAEDGRIVTNERGGIPVASTLTRAWKEARPFALTPEQVNSKLAETPYTGRHAALSGQLNAGMDPTDIAERAGNSPEVLLRIYAKTVHGREEHNNKLIEKMLDRD